MPQADDTAHATGAGAQASAGRHLIVGRAGAPAATRAASPRETDMDETYGVRLCEIEANCQEQAWYLTDDGAACHGHYTEIAESRVNSLR